MNETKKGILIKRNEKKNGLINTHPNISLGYNLTIERRFI